jgi:protein-tyrosine sulfotransferase
MRRIKLARRLQKISEFLPKKYPVQAVEPLENQPFFVLGSGRNGSTMLNRMLNMHPNLFLPSEQGFLGNSIIKFKLYNFLIWRDLMKIIAGELLLVTGSHTWNFSPEEVFADLNGIDDRSLQSVIDLIYSTYGNKNKSFKIWGDTTPLNTFYLPEIHSAFPQAKYIFLLRDGRDVVASYKKGGEYLGDLIDPNNAATHWLESIAKYDWIKEKVNVLLVKYEDLVADPESKLKEVCDHLNVEFSKTLLDFYRIDLNNPLYLEPQHSNLNKPVFKSSIGNFKKELNGAELEKVVGMIERQLSRFSYL